VSREFSWGPHQKELVRVDGHGIEFGGFKSLQHLLGGELGSVVELAFSRNNNHQFTIRALRHGGPSSSGGHLLNHHPVVLNEAVANEKMKEEVANEKTRETVFSFVNAAASPAVVEEHGDEGQGRVQSEVVRLSQRLATMEREALDRKEREKEKEREAEGVGEVRTGAPIECSSSPTPSCYHSWRCTRPSAIIKTQALGIVCFTGSRKGKSESGGDLETRRGRAPCC